jgi:hypothetical protein
MSATNPPTRTAVRITRSRENIQAIPIPRAAHLTHQSPGDVIALITTRTTKITGPMNKNLTARRVLNIFLIFSFACSAQLCARAVHRAIIILGHLWSRRTHGWLIKRRAATQGQPGSQSVGECPRLISVHRSAMGKTRRGRIAE